MSQKILIVDDSDGDQFIFNRIIKKALVDPSLSSAYNGEEAVGLIQSSEEPFDLIFLDINMPRLNGLEVLEKISPNLPEVTKVFMLTTSVFDAEREQSLSYPCVKEFLSKPLSLSKLEELIVQYAN